MLQKSTIQLLRIPFSFFLMPVFWFALSLIHHIDLPKSLLIFFILHILLFPSGNGYNSYMDKDETSIGGLEKPMQPTYQLFLLTIIMDGIAIVLSCLISWYFLLGCLCYVLCSRAYSFRGIRLKKYPILGYLTVVINQGAIIFYMVYVGASITPDYTVPWLAVLAAAFLIGGFYPITQVYQHEADKKDGVRTISMMLGIRGTFIFCAIMYTIAFGLLFTFYTLQNKLTYFIVLQLFFIPVLFFFLRWFVKVWKNNAVADFKHTMAMNTIASLFTNLAFIALLILHQYG